MRTISRTLALVSCVVLGCRDDDGASSAETDLSDDGSGTDDSDDTSTETAATRPNPGDSSASTEPGDSTAADAGTDDGDTTEPTTAGGDIEEIPEMSDEFDDPDDSEARWSFRHEVEGEDSQFQEFTFGGADDDRARMVPTRGGWFGAFKGPYVFQPIDGDFMMEAHVLAHRSGAPEQAPEQPYNSAGLLIRNPGSGPDSENWVLHHLGMHDPQGAGVGVERKITRNSNSDLMLTANDFSGRIRICRVGNEIALTRQLDDENGFSVSAEYTLELDDEVQAGFSLTAWNSRGAEPDLTFDGDVVGVWDYVRYYRIDDISACLEET